MLSGCLQVAGCDAVCMGRGEEVRAAYRVARVESFCMLHEGEDDSGSLEGSSSARLAAALPQNCVSHRGKEINVVVAEMSK